MTNRRYLIGMLLGAIGALTFASMASANATSMGLQTTLAPAKQDRKVFGGVSLHNIISTSFDNFATPHTGPQKTVFTIDPNVRFVNGNIPPCPLSAIQGKFDAQARAACPRSITGQGTVQVNNGALNGNVTFFSGGPNTIYVQTDIGPGATTLTIVGTITGKILTFTNIPDTPGLLLTKFDTTFNKRKTGKMKVKVKGKRKKVPTYYVMARCKKKKWSTSATNFFYNGQTLTASTSQKCKAKGKKKKK